LFHNLHLVKCHRSMEFSMGVIKPCLTWLDQWWNKTANIIYGLCFRNYRFHWIEYHHNPLKWHRTSYNCLFLNFGMQGICKMFTTKIELVSLCRLSQRMSMGIPSTMNPNTKWLSLKGEFLMKEFSLERFKWEENRTWWGY
jgi:hypothetical protein